MNKFIFLTAFIVSLGLGWLSYQWYFPAQRIGGMITKIDIAPGEGVHQISRNLYDGALIRNRWWWETYVWLRGWGSRFQIGEFEISPAMSGAKIASILTAHEGKADRMVTIIEGWTLSDIAKELDFPMVPWFDHISFPSLASSVIVDYSYLFKQFSFLQERPQGVGLEGYLFPDTYRISKYAVDPAKQLVEKALANFDQKVTLELRAEIKRQGRDLHEVITMASILEAEVQTPEDRALVADLLWRRLKIGMALQVDSAPETYKSRGLPPGPINNPGMSAIMAAIYPKANQYWYFLTAKNDGHVVYAKIFAEHVQNKRKWLN